MKLLFVNVIPLLALSQATFVIENEHPLKVEEVRSF